MLAARAAGTTFARDNVIDADDRTGRTLGFRFDLLFEFLIEIKTAGRAVAIAVERLLFFFIRLFFARLVLSSAPGGN